MGLHREQSRGKHPWEPLVLIPPPDTPTHPPTPRPTVVSLPQCQSSGVTGNACARVSPSRQVFDGAVIVLSLAPMVASTVANGPSSPWDAIGLIVTLRIWRVKRIIDGERGWRGEGGAVRGPLTSPSPPPHPVLCCQVIEIDTAVRSRRISVDTQSPAFSTLPLFPLNNPWKLAEHRRKLPRDLPYMCRMPYIHWGDRSVLLPFFVV